MTSQQAEHPWVDVLTRKHECGPWYSEPARLRLTLGHEDVDVLVPEVRDKPERLEICDAVVSADRICLIGRHTLSDGSDPYECGVLMIGRKTDALTYTIHVWHELFPYALKYLGVAERRLRYTVISSPSAED